MCQQPEIRGLCETAWSVQFQDSQVSGPIHTIFGALAKLRWAWPAFSTFQPFDFPSFNWLTCSLGWFKYRIRNAFRTEQFHLAVQRCAHFQCLEVVDKAASVWQALMRVTRLNFCVLVRLIGLCVTWWSSDSA